MGRTIEFGLIGGGNMGEALIRGLIESKLTVPTAIMAADPVAERRAHLAEIHGITVVESNLEVARSAAVIILAVKPQIMPRILEEIGREVDSDGLVISIAAGINLQTLQSAFGHDVPVIRAMPNTPALILKGATAMAPGRFVSAQHLSLARRLFEAVGLVIQVEEKDMDAVTGLSGSGPAYVFIILEALADAGVLVGLPRDKALLLAGQTILGSARLAQERGIHPGQLKDMVASPGGTTIAGLKVLEKGGLRGLLMEAVDAATRRSAELGRQS